MPYIAITMLPGRTPEQKKSLARKLRDLLCEELELDNMLVSVSVEDLPFEGWCEFLGEMPEESIIIPEERGYENFSNNCNCKCSC